MQVEKFYGQSLAGSAQLDTWAYYSLNLSTIVEPTTKKSFKDLGPTWDIVI